MAAIYLKENLEDLLKDKYVLLLGDSVQRSVYKDLVVLCHDNRFMAQNELRQKGEESFLNDNLLFRSELTNGTHYREEREYKSGKFHFKYHFLTRIYNDYVESILKDIEEEITACPDVLVINSCLWDISRYGDKSMVEYRNNIEKLCKRLKEMLPDDTLVIWRTALPVSETMKGGFLTPEVESVRNALRMDIMRGNYYAYNIVSRFDFDVLDMHYHFQYQLHRRASDGVHWNMFAHRRMTNILLSHISQAWEKELPQLPWADNSRIDFASDDIAMNTTNVLKQAYEPIPGLRQPLPPLMKIPINPGLKRPLLQRPYTQEDYSNIYSVPREEEYAPDGGGMYQFLSQEPIFDRSDKLPLSPYPSPRQAMYSAKRPRKSLLDLNPKLGPVRNVKKWSSRNIPVHPRGNATERLKMRIQKERVQQRRMPYASQPSRYLPEQYYESPPRLRTRWNRPSPRNMARYNMDSVENHWSQFSRHHPQYNSYDDRFHEDT